MAKNEEKDAWIGLVIVVLILLSLAGGSGDKKPGYVHVKGYTRDDGTYVRPHYRTYPNNTEEDNLSYKKKSYEEY